MYVYASCCKTVNFYAEASETPPPLHNPATPLSPTPQTPKPLPVVVRVGIELIICLVAAGVGSE